MTMKDDMVALTANIKKIKQEKEAEEREKATAKAKRVGRIDAEKVIEELLTRIEKAAKNGENSVYEWCHAGSECGVFKLGIISKWAKEQGFKTEFVYGREPANEGGDPWNTMTISWE